jgi:hypothetical protein
MAKKQPAKTSRTATKRVRHVSVDQQNPASTNVQSLVKSLAKRKERKKATN